MGFQATDSMARIKLSCPAESQTTCVDCSGLSHPAYGQVTPTTTVPFGQSAIYTCAKGYTLIGDSTRTCQQGGTWSGSEPTCGKPCPLLTSPENGQVSSDGNMIGSEATYTCSKGFIISPNTARVCQDNYTWSGVEPSCTKPAAATTTTVSPATAPTKPDSTTNNGTTTQAPPTCDSKNQTDCCAAKATCQFVNCTDLTDATKVHQGCHSKDEDLTKYCVNNTWTDLCATAPGSTQAPSSSSTPSPTGGAPQPSKGGDKGKRQGFDAASFIGGIFLFAGIVAIIFFGLKFYKARTERNYHTLH